MAERASRYQERVVAEFCANKGKVGGYFTGMSLLLLTTTGARTGQRRRTPLTYMADGDRFVVHAANAGAPRNPDWFHNIVANPDVTIDLGTEAFDATAIVTNGEERAALLARLAAIHPEVDAYQAGTSREIPVVAFVRRDGSAN